MSYEYRDKKLVIVLAANLEAGVAAHVVAHLSLAIGHRVPLEDMGKEQLVDDSQFGHMGISKYPIVITKVKPGRLKKLLVEAQHSEQLLLADYPEEMLITSHDDELAHAMKNKKTKEFNYFGVALYGNSNELSLLTGKFTLWR